MSDGVVRCVGKDRIILTMQFAFIMQREVQVAEQEGTVGQMQSERSGVAMNCPPG